MQPFMAIVARERKLPKKQLYSQMKYCAPFQPRRPRSPPLSKDNEAGFLCVIQPECTEGPRYTSPKLFNKNASICRFLHLLFLKANLGKSLQIGGLFFRHIDNPRGDYLLFRHSWGSGRLVENNRILSYFSLLRPKSFFEF